MTSYYNKQTLHPLPSGYAKVVKRDKSGGAWVKFDSGEKIYFHDFWKYDPDKRIKISPND